MALCWLNKADRQILDQGRNNRHVPITLIAGALLHALGALLWPELIPLRIVGFILMLSGYLGLLTALGLGRPLNILSAVLAGYAAVGHLGWLLVKPAVGAFGLLYILCLLAALFVTSIAGIHRDGALRRAGVVGAAGAAVPISGLIGGHIALGGFGLIGIRVGQGALATDTLLLWPADLILAGWAISAGVFVLLRPKL